MPARDMPGAQVSAVDYAPQGWPPGTYTIIRRVQVDTEEISGDARSRRRRTIPKTNSSWPWTGPSTTCGR